MKKTNTIFRKIDHLFKRCLLLTSLLTGLSAFSQQDTVFWFAAPDVSSAVNDNPIYLRFLSYDTPATITVSQPANGTFVPLVVNLAANSNDSINLTPYIADVESPGADIVATNGLKISSTVPITAYYEITANGNKEIFSLKGNKALGTNFYTPFQKNWDNAVIAPATFSSIDIVASEDNTTIVITPKTDIVGHSVGSTYNVVLNEGETYSARDVNVSASTSLAGSIVSSDKPISVTLFSGALNNSGCTSTMGDQITPTDYLGQDFIIHKGNSIGDRVYILATQNSTAITIENTSTTNTLINWSETYEYVLTDTVNYIHTSKPVYIWHASGYGCNLAGAQVPNIYCAGKYSQNFGRSTTDSLGLLLHVRTGFEDQFEINGNPSLIDPLDFDVVPGTSGEYMVGLFYFNTADIPVNSYNLVTNTGDIFGLAVLNGEGGQGSSYAYLSEFESYPYVDAGMDATVCANIPFNLNGIVGGGSITGVWGGSGFGSFENGLDTLNNIYYPSDIDTIISPINLILTSTGPCPVQKDTLILTVTPAPIVNANADQTVCANNADVSLDGSVSGGSTTGTWSTLGSGTFSPGANTLNAVYTPSPADTAAGTVTLVLTSTGSNPCTEETDTLILTITDSPVVDAGPDTLYVCSNNANFNLSGTVYGGTTTGKWTTSGNGLFSPDNLTLNTQYQPSPTDVNGGQITIYLESTSNGSCMKAEDSIIVIFTPAPVVNAGGDILACTNDEEIDLSGTVSGPTTTGTWSGGAGTFSPDPNTLNATYTPDPGEITAGTVTLVLTSTNNNTCIAENDQIEIDFVAPPSANFSYIEVCQNDTTFFTDFSLDGFGNIVSWSWDFGDGNTDNVPNPSHIYTDFGSHAVELIVESDAGCTDTATFNVDAYEVPVSDFNYSTSCDNDQVIIDFSDASTISTGAINNWLYGFGGQGSQAVQNPTQLFTGDGNFVITQIVSSENGCADTSIQTINVPPKPIAGFYYNTSNGLNIGAEFTFVDTSDYANAWSWDFGNGDTSTFQDPTTVYFANGSYDVTLYATGPLGCVDSTTTTIEINTVTTEINQLIPNAISPNGDGKNDVWKLEFINYVNPEAQVIVFNRWGQTLYESTGYSEPWDGTFEGEPVPEGTYFYIIKISDEEIYEGSILVLTTN